MPLKLWESYKRFWINNWKMGYQFIYIIFLITTIIIGIYLIYTKNSEIGLWLTEISYIIALIIVFIFRKKIMNYFERIWDKYK
jgi:hypothetical protein